MISLSRRYNWWILIAHIATIIIHFIPLYYLICKIVGVNIAEVAEDNILLALISMITVLWVYDFKFSTKELVDGIDKTKYPDHAKIEFKSSVDKLFDKVQREKYIPNLELRSVADLEARYYSESSEKFLRYNIALNLYKRRVALLILESTYIIIAFIVQNKLSSLGLIAVIYLSIVLIVMNIKVSKKYVLKLFDSYLYTFERLFINTLKGVINDD